MIKSGPMVGYCSFNEVGLWVQITKSAKVKFCYWPISDIGQRVCTNEVLTGDRFNNIVQSTATFLEEGTTYQYEVIVNNKLQELDQELTFTTQNSWNRSESPPNFSFATGSCADIISPNEQGYVEVKSRYEIFDHITKDDPDFMLWLGDNVYFRKEDWNSKSGMYHRYDVIRSLPNLKSLLATTPQYAIWDDHDYGPNNSNRSFYLKNHAKTAFTDYWMNPSYGVGDLSGITGFYSWSDCDFYLLDNRWDRSIEGKDGQILGEKQIEWLIEALRASKATFKFVCIGGQILSDLSMYENYAVYANERKRILDMIKKYEVKNVVFLTGDRHHSEISKINLGGIEVYDITSSPLTSNAYDHTLEENSNRIKGTIIGTQNYALIKVSGDKDNRVVDVSFKNTFGTQLVSYRIEQSK